LTVGVVVSIGPDVAGDDVGLAGVVAWDAGVVVTIGGLADVVGLTPGVVATIRRLRECRVADAAAGCLGQAGIERPR
jgi:hypothetical protein